MITTRAGAEHASRSFSISTSRKPARWLTSNVASRPSAVTVRRAYTVPALLISPSIWAYRSSRSRPSERTESSEEKSALWVSTRAAPARRTASSAASRRSGLRPTSTRWCPSAASWSEDSNPMPAEAPVTTIVSTGALTVSSPVSSPDQKVMPRAANLAFTRSAAACPSRASAVSYVVLAAAENDVSTAKPNCASIRVVSQARVVLPRPT